MYTPGNRKIVRPSLSCIVCVQGGLNKISKLGNIPRAKISSENSMHECMYFRFGMSKQFRQNLLHLYPSSFLATNQFMGLRVTQ